jgi:hypothetical protein
VSFWQNLSPGTRRYIIVALVLLGAMLVFRRCTAHAPAAEVQSTRGAPR